MIKILYVPEYLFADNKVFGLSYVDLLPGFDLGIFPSKYEPWGYTPHEAIAAGVATVTSNTAGFGAFIEKNTQDKEICLLNRTHDFSEATIATLRSILLDKSKRDEAQIKTESALARFASHKCTWKKFIKYYLDAYRIEK